MIGRLITLTNLNRLLQRLQSQQLARPERFELPTPRFEAWCSIQLSYGRRTRSLGSLAAKVKALSALLSAPQHLADTT
jgi:hypothetical protein